MAELSLGERRDLIAQYVDEAKINWSHIAVAQLVKTGYVDRVLTTNFDPLVVRACAYVGVFPAVYDFAASEVFQPADIPDQAIFYLHGQRTGFVLMNTDQDFSQHSDLLAPVFEDAGRGRVWLVVGYSGESDPVFDLLAAVERFDNYLYWVGFRDADPPQHVSDRLLREGKYAFFVPGYDADSFFVRLAQQLDAFPPDFVATPFDYLEGLLDEVTPYLDPRASNQGSEGRELDILSEAREVIRTANRTVQQDPVKRRVQEAESALVAGDYERVVRMVPFFEANPDPELGDAIARAYMGQAGELVRSIDDGDFEDASEKMDLAEAHGREAVKISTDNGSAANVLANVLGARVRFGVLGDRTASEILNEGKLVLEAVVEGHPNPSWYYNLACLYGLGGEEEETRTTLEAMISVAEPGLLISSSHMASDADLASVRTVSGSRNFSPRSRTRSAS